ncbi:MAG: DUF1772 domain-containing protein [Kibdelosporangium sp.]
MTTLLMGLAAGFFYTYSISIMPTLRGVDDRTFVDVMQKINRDVQNPRFFLSFMGSLLFGLVTLIMFLGQPFEVLLPVILGFVAYFVCFAVTASGNVPMNNRLERKGDPSRISDLALARKEFEDRWTRLNGIRAWAAFLGLGGMVWANIAYAAG